MTWGGVRKYNENLSVRGSVINYMNLQPKQSKYTAQMIIDIYRMAAKGDHKPTIAKQYGISGPAVHMVFNTVKAFLDGTRRVTDQTSDAYADAIAVLGAQPQAAAPELQIVEEVVAKPSDSVQAVKGEIHKTTDYAQFKSVVGNRPVNKMWVERLAKAIFLNNLLSNYPILVSRDGYLLDGQHRLAAATKLETPVYFTVSSQNVDDFIVSRINNLQHTWTRADYIHWYASRGNEQFQFLEQLMEEYHVRPSIVQVLYRINSDGLYHGEISLYTNDEEKAACIKLMNDYLKIRTYMVPQTGTHGKFVTAVRMLLEQTTVDKVMKELNSWNKEFEYKRTVQEYLRQFEEVFNYRKQENNYVRFF